MADRSSRRAGASSETSIVRIGLINPNWHFEGSIYFGCLQVYSKFSDVQEERPLPLAELENVRPGSV